MFLTLITHKSLTSWTARILQVIHSMLSLITEPMTHKEQLDLRLRCRGIRGAKGDATPAIALQPDGKVIIYSQKPVYDQVKLIFPNCYIEYNGPLPLDTAIYRFQITFIPDRYVKPAEVLKMVGYA